ncbi:ABC transporter ATP-binding protein [Anaerococcus sp. AGMB00486]|uniref:ABC transporter ATP-binding protein n=1 Tax=Anaerococcus faecalis TaxID=2742993 RepID=A0ABX2N896_9FIRM|nr:MULTISPECIES: ABC transporter ATP-binding protein [Anaerococcus]MDY3006413.1 ABC transporter ATP-binding protein [Anaerococcus porci]NVF10926.1 ABC transporter ATP-binding protein [Anaerococcus faecalis]
MENRTYSDKELIKKFIPYYKNYKDILAKDLFSAFLTTVCELLLPILLSILTDNASNSSLTFDIIIKLTLLYILTKLVEVAGRYFMQSYGHIMGAHIEKDMRADIFKHFMTMSTAFFNETKIGQLMSRMTTDLFDITEFSHHCPEEFFIGFIKLSISFIVLMTINIQLTLLIYIIIPIMVYAARIKRRAFSKSVKSEKKQIGEINASIEDTLLGIDVVKSFANEELEKKKFKKGNDKFVDIKKVKYYNMASYNLINQLFAGLMYGVLIVVGGYFVIKKSMSPGDLVAFVLYLNTIIATVNRLVEFTDQYQKGITGIERFNEVMNLRSDIFDREDAKELKNVKGSIVFDKVFFKYPDQAEDDPWILDNISFNINVGENIALVGPSGAGKSTITKLIPRFYEVNKGEIRVDGININNLTLESLRNNIGIVQQDVYLFGGTIRENIEYGKENTTDEEIIEASKLAGAYDFIMDLPYGFDTYIGERGVKLSGGQKQRISIARVFLKNPPILILDEATSSLDNTSEAIVQESLEKLTKGRTTLTIAHRLSTIINADSIIVLTEDGIAERGSHHELLDKKGVYYKLYNSNNEDLFG